MLSLASKITAWISVRAADVEERGASAVEYALMVGVFALFIVVAVSGLSKRTEAIFNKAAVTWPS
jgi:Flp pilus assembly pilin Flp